ncbi:putative protein SUPPRESSOR OF GENE SILENCING 3 [Helianthus annuus]|nr:putative protein SUPPRESSOR OF GENE SILENCING 3 [Helianthus annuus]KAJ0684314.1 putative protein SUPPRESSOR OF GENE SILENCING 3 [Helianthus annuus]
MIFELSHPVFFEFTNSIVVQSFPSLNSRFTNHVSRFPFYDFSDLFAKFRNPSQTRLFLRCFASQITNCNSPSEIRINPHRRIINPHRRSSTSQAKLRLRLAFLICQFCFYFVVSFVRCNCIRLWVVAVS